MTSVDERLEQIEAQIAELKARQDDNLKIGRALLFAARQAFLMINDALERAAIKWAWLSGPTTAQLRQEKKREKTENIG